jgi:glycosyltransferase involved in cell wall biosynthesis
MHVVMFGDQHVESMGGAQVSMRLQRKFLERAGHIVTIVAPRMHARPRSVDPAYVDTPSLPTTLDREYALTWPGRAADRYIDRALGARPPVDIVHVQADFWGAFLGHRFARRHDAPVVHTMHNRVDVGITAANPLPATTLRVLNAWQRHAVPSAEAGPREQDGWSYLHGFAADANTVTAPSSHFARRLVEHNVCPRVEVVWNGIDDDALDSVAASRGPRRCGPVRFAWIGRMSPEKRLLPFLQALTMSGVRAEVDVIGGGVELRAAQRMTRRERPAAAVRFSGRLPYAEVLNRIADVDAVVQTSVGFETQCMTVFEAAAIGTPSIVSDPDVSAELGNGVWDVQGAGTVAGIARALERAVRDIEAGTAPVPDASIAERFRQSACTAAMIELYERTMSTNGPTRFVNGRRRARQLGAE